MHAPHSILGRLVVAVAFVVPGTALVGATTASAAVCRVAGAPVIGRGPTTAKRVALTFDDGPSAAFTPQILKILAAKHVHATFFFVGVWVHTYPKVAASVARAGHTIGAHSYTHPTNPTTGAAELARTVREIKRATGVTPRYVRPPGGCYNKAFVAAAAKAGLRLVMWTGDSGDWHAPRHSAASICRDALRGVKAGAIIVFHDGTARGATSHQPTVDALRCVIDGVRARGFQPVSLSELLAR
jgi:peptidoglycan-N-acetylglucosamine deacetylase